MKNTKQDGLATKLKSYEASAKSLVAERESSRFGSWPVYAAATGSALAMATAANAGIIYSGPLGPITATAVQNGGLATAAINIDGVNFRIGVQSTRNFTFVSSSYVTGSRKGLANFSVGAVGAGILRNSSGQLQRLASGANISGGLFLNGAANLRSVQISTFSGLDSGTSYNGTWVDGQTSIAGIQRAPGQFGWIRLRFDEVNRIPHSISAIEWAYNDNGSILAGQTTDAAVPEPGTMALMLLSSGAAGILALRRRKKAS